MSEDGEGKQDIRECPHQRSTQSHQRAPTQYWWPSQRFIDEVFPANTFSLADMDKSNYSYQLYAHPGVRNSDDLRASQMASKSCYNIRRVAVDRPHGTKNDTECQQLHWATKPWLMESDRTAHNNGGDAKQPITPVNPFAVKSDGNAASDQSHTTCASSSTGSGSASSTSVGSCSRREGFNDNQNNNHLENVNGTVTCTGSGCASWRRTNYLRCKEDDSRNNSYRENVVGAVGKREPESGIDYDCDWRSKRFDQKCGVDNEKLGHSTPKSHLRGSKDPDPCDISSAQPRGTIGCNDFLPQLALPSEIRDPKTAPAHCTPKGDPGGVGGKSRRDKMSLSAICSTADQTKEVHAGSVSSRHEVTPGYGTYKIIGGRQYKEWPQQDPRVDMELPAHLSQYREYQRRCPCPRLGRYDRSDPDNEMLLPSHRNTTLLKASLSPFTFLRDPKPHRKMAAECRHENKATKSGSRTLQWMLPSFL